MAKVKKVKRLKLKRPIVITMKILVFIVVICGCCLVFYNMQIKSLTSLGYSEVASKNILRAMKKDYIMQMGENKTLNAAFESDDYVEVISKKELINKKEYDYLVKKYI